MEVLAKVSKSTIEVVWRSLCIYIELIEFNCSEDIIKYVSRTYINVSICMYECI